MMLCAISCDTSLPLEREQSDLAWISMYVLSSAEGPPPLLSLSLSGSAILSFLEGVVGELSLSLVRANGFVACILETYRRCRKSIM